MYCGRLIVVAENPVVLVRVFVAGVVVRVEGQSLMIADGEGAFLGDVGLEELCAHQP